MGTGRGYNLLYLIEKGYKGIAIDKDEKALFEIENLAKIFNINIETLAIDFFDKQKLPQVYTIFNSGVMEHFSKDQIEELLNIWSKKSKYMILSIPFKTHFSKLKKLYGDEKFYSYAELKKVIQKISNIKLIEAISYNYSFGVYNRIRKFLLPPSFREGPYKILDWFLRKIDFICGNELLLILKI